jgi:hypothetical protein
MILESESWRERIALFVGEVKLTKSVDVSTPDTACDESISGWFERIMEFAVKSTLFWKLRSLE